MSILIKYFIEGFIIGLGKIIPGVSGALMAMIFGVYESIIECLTNPKMIIKKHRIIVPLLFGISFAIVFGSNILLVLLEQFYLESMACFIGMMSFSIIPIIKKNKKIKLKGKEIIIIVFINLMLLLLMFIPFNYNRPETIGIFRDAISLFLCGILDAIATIVPGISGTALLMLVGYYKIVISSISILYLPVLLPFLLGIIFGLFYLAKIINYLFKMYKNFMNLLVASLSIISTLILIVDLISKVTLHHLFTVSILFIIGLLLAYIIETKLS